MKDMSPPTKKRRHVASSPKAAKGRPPARRRTTGKTANGGVTKTKTRTPAAKKAAVEPIVPDQQQPANQQESVIAKNEEYLVLDVTKSVVIIAYNTYSAYIFNIIINLENLAFFDGRWTVFRTKEVLDASFANVRAQDFTDDPWSVYVHETFCHDYDRLSAEFANTELYLMQQIHMAFWNFWMQKRREQIVSADQFQYHLLISAPIATRLYMNAYVLEEVDKYMFTKVPAVKQRRNNIHQWLMAFVEFKDWINFPGDANFARKLNYVLRLLPHVVPAGRIKPMRCFFAFLYMGQLAYDRLDAKPELAKYKQYIVNLVESLDVCGHVLHNGTFKDTRVVTDTLDILDNLPQTL